MRDTPSPSCLAIDSPPVTLGDGGGVAVADGSVFDRPAVTAGGAGAGALRVSGSRVIVPAGIDKTQRTLRACNTGRTAGLASVAAQTGRSEADARGSFVAGREDRLSACSEGSALTTCSGSGRRMVSEVVAADDGRGSAGAEEATTGGGNGAYDACGNGAVGAVFAICAGGGVGAGGVGGTMAARAALGAIGAPDEGGAAVATAADARRQSMTRRKGLYNG